MSVASCAAEQSASAPGVDVRSSAAARHERSSGVGGGVAAPVLRGAAAASASADVGRACAAAAVADNAHSCSALSADAGSSGSAAAAATPRARAAASAAAAAASPSRCVAAVLLRTIAAMARRASSAAATVPPFASPPSPPPLPLALLALLVSLIPGTPSASLLPSTLPTSGRWVLSRTTVIEPPPPSPSSLPLSSLRGCSRPAAYSAASASRIRAQSTGRSSAGRRSSRSLSPASSAGSHRAASAGRAVLVAAAHASGAAACAPRSPLGASADSSLSARCSSAPHIASSVDAAMAEARAAGGGAVGPEAAGALLRLPAAPPPGRRAGCVLSANGSPSCASPVASSASCASVNAGSCRAASCSSACRHAMPGSQPSRPREPKMRARWWGARREAGGDGGGGIGSRVAGALRSPLRPPALAGALRSPLRPPALPERARLTTFSPPGMPSSPAPPPRPPLSPSPPLPSPLLPPPMQRSAMASSHAASVRPSATRVPARPAATAASASAEKPRSFGATAAPTPATMSSNRRRSSAGAPPALAAWPLRVGPASAKLCRGCSLGNARSRADRRGSHERNAHTLGMNAARRPGVAAAARRGGKSGRRDCGCGEGCVSTAAGSASARTMESMRRRCCCHTWPGPSDGTVFIFWDLHGSCSLMRFPGSLDCANSRFKSGCAVQLRPGTINGALCNH
eukprot:364051-Chlamydomonas_euryale.AAC.8